MVLAFALSLLLADIASLPAPFGKQLYTTYCSSCHGEQAYGGADAPNLHGVGMAALDFYLMTGRMPAAVPWLQVEHRGERRGQMLDSGEIAAIEAYLAPIVGKPGIPIVIAGGDLEHGRKLYALNCEHCHAIKGDGGGIGRLEWAPVLHHASINQVAEAIRVGPGEMPRFGEHQISQDDLDDLATYVISFDAQGEPADVPPFRSTGPIPEGAVGWIGIILLIVFVFAYWRSDTKPSKREESVRPGAGEGSS